jgi:hypothetical protein
MQSKWHRDNLGKMYEFIDNLTSMRVERSAYYALANGIELSEEEFAAITFLIKQMIKWQNTITQC